MCLLVYVSNLVKKWLHKQTGKQKTCQETVRQECIQLTVTNPKKTHTQKKKKPIQAAQEDEKEISQAPKSIPISVKFGVNDCYL